MNLYLIERTDHWGYDDYDSAVVCAENVEEARRTEVAVSKYGFNPWTTPDNVKVKMLGTAKDNIEKGVVLASFNAG